jgi:hypothetical protein
MRRLLYLAVALVLLALTGLVFVRITAADAFVARQRVSQIRPGMTVREVRQLMSDVPAERAHLGFPTDGWEISDRYWLTVDYTMDNKGPLPLEGPDLEKAYVVESQLHCSNHGTLDRILEWLGYPKAIEFGF